MGADLVRIVRDFTRAIVNPYDPQDLLHRLTVQSMELLAAAGSGIMLKDENGDLAFAAASEDRIMEIELHQQRANEGACFEAFMSNELVLVADVEAEAERWPRYVERVRDNGMGAVIGVPMNAFGRTIGVINIYRDAPQPWTGDDVTAAEIMAAMGAGYVVHANELRAQYDLTEQLQAAIDSRDLIGQAKGIVMARLSVDANQAFGLLSSLSQTRNTKLRDIAADVVEGTVDPSTLT
jgi:GAF domain-containing protein